jgi:predicted nucleic acid-binding protein
MAEHSARLIVDTNIWLERMLDQERAGEVARFLDCVPDRELAMSEFTLYSIGHILIAREQFLDLRRFVADTIVDGHVARVQLASAELDDVVDVAQHQFNLDFDDAYQYVAATSRDLELVSFDTDFDRTDLDRLEPQDVLDRRA